jgi:hypothetical protein
MNASTLRGSPHSAMFQAASERPAKINELVIYLSHGSAINVKKADRSRAQVTLEEYASLIIMHDIKSASYTIEQRRQAHALEKKGADSLGDITSLLSKARMTAGDEDFAVAVAVAVAAADADAFVADAEECLFEAIESYKKTINPDVTVTLCLDANMGDPGGSRVTPLAEKIINEIHPRYVVLFSQEAPCRESADRYLEAGGHDFFGIVLDSAHLEAAFSPDMMEREAAAKSLEASTASF